MAKLLTLTILAAVLAASSAGIVEHIRCGGVGTFRELRIEGCQGRICHMTAGVAYPSEGDLIPSTSSPSLSLRITATFLGMPVLILDTELPNSSVQAGQLYIVRFTIVPNDILADNDLPIQAEVRATSTSFIEICVGFQVRVCADFSVCG